MMQKFILVDNKAELADAWNKEFEFDDNVEAHGPADIFSFEGDACVSPANSFGFMDGGIDLLYSMNMGWHVSAQLKNKIQTEYDGELLVGQAVVIPTGYARFPNIICAPTMRVPCRLVGTHNVYLAAKAMFLAAKRHPEFKTIVCPGLGTGTGGVSAAECARIMKLAYDDWYLEKAVINGTLMPGQLSDVFVLGNKHTTRATPPPGDGALFTDDNVSRHLGDNSKKI